MKRVSNYAHPTRNQFPGLHPEVDKALKVMGKQIQELTEVLQGQLILEANGNYERKEVTIRHDRDYTFGLETLKGPPQGVLVFYSSWQGLWPIIKNFQVLSERSFRSRFVFEPPLPSGDVTLRLLVMGS